MGKRVLCCGTFDQLHPGHDAFLRQASGLGSELVVVVARDENVARIKGRPPLQDEETRRAAIGALGYVTEARLGNRGADLLRVVAEVAPQVIALGYDQRVPAGLAAAFPDCQIVVLDPYQPDRFKSSLMRKAREP
ncbi:MAG: adenylyltransferase/cytidyltransferase family protein [Gemmatimonadota bacterium]